MVAVAKWAVLGEVEGPLLVWLQDIAVNFRRRRTWLFLWSMYVVVVVVAVVVGVVREGPRTGQ